MAAYAVCVAYGYICCIWLHMLYIAAFSCIWLHMPARGPIEVFSLHSLFHVFNAEVLYIRSLFYIYWNSFGKWTRNFNYGGMHILLIEYVTECNHYGMRTRSEGEQGRRHTQNLCADCLWQMCYKRSEIGQTPYTWTLHVFLIVYVSVQELCRWLYACPI